MFVNIGKYVIILFEVTRNLDNFNVLVISLELCVDEHEFCPFSTHPCYKLSRYNQTVGDIVNMADYQYTKKITKAIAEFTNIFYVFKTHFECKFVQSHHFYFYRLMLIVKQRENKRVVCIVYI